MREKRTEGNIRLVLGGEFLDHFRTSTRVCSIILGHDLDGDGGADALYVTERGMLAARRVSDGLQIDSGDFWEYVSPRSVFRLDVAHFNSDGRPDFILRHGTASTVLVSVP